MSHQQHEPLATLDRNVQTKQDANPDPLSTSNDKPVPAYANESQQHQSLHSKLMKQQTFVDLLDLQNSNLTSPRRTGQQAGAYVSPSDDIMSPASSKLNAFKQKRFAK